MHIISRRPLEAYWKKHPETEQPLKAWYAEVSTADWKTPQDIKLVFATASFVGNNRVVFNIKGNHHRLVVAVAYQYGRVYIKFVGTHAEYDRIDVATVNLEK